MNFPGIDVNGKRDPNTIVFSGTTSSRPTGVPAGFEYFDTTLGKAIWWSGTTWITDLGAVEVGDLAAVDKAANVAAPSAITAYAAVTNMTAQVTKAEGEAVSAALHTLQLEVAALRTTVANLLLALKAGVMTAD